MIMAKIIKIGNGAAVFSAKAIRVSLLTSGRFWMKLLLKNEKLLGKSFKQAKKQGNGSEKIFVWKYHGNGFMTFSWQIFDKRVFEFKFDKCLNNYKINVCKNCIRKPKNLLLLRDGQTHMDHCTNLCKDLLKTI